ncbi:DNA alkylation repair protein [Candidatus Saccharibacteria bacterium]|nr:DNA alkylation repair protein [Candidatus Saccharibacteria bacterium]
MNRFELELRQRLEDWRDEAYGDFIFRGVPGMKREQILGVRVPEIRAALWETLMLVFDSEMLRKGLTLSGEGVLDEGLYHEMNIFLNNLPHFYREYDHANVAIINRMNNFEECIELLNKFLPHVNNWEICDAINPKVFRKHPKEVWQLCEGWLGSLKPFQQRFGIVTAMRYFLDDERFFEEQFDWIEMVAHQADTVIDIRDNWKKMGWDWETWWTDDEAYYVRMAIAWYLATALAKQWEAALSVLTEERLPTLVHNRAIQKALESRRISQEQKELLRELKR